VVRQLPSQINCTFRFEKKLYFAFLNRIFSGSICF